MFLKIDISSPVPVYQQIITQIKYSIARGALKPGDKLPTVRDVAAENRINRNTVARAYMDLEREGILVGRAGQGSFVSDNAPLLHPKEARQTLSNDFDEILSKAYHLKISKDDVEKIFIERLNKINLPEK